MIDRFGREIQQDGNRYWVEGIEVIADTDEQALAVFNAMAPGGWSESVEAE